jgi:hypothetical protein
VAPVAPERRMSVAAAGGSGARSMPASWPSTSEAGARTPVRPTSRRPPERHDRSVPTSRRIGRPRGLSSSRSFGVRRWSALPRGSGGNLFRSRETPRRVMARTVRTADRTGDVRLVGTAGRAATGDRLDCSQRAVDPRARATTRPVATRNPTTISVSVSMARSPPGATARPSGPGRPKRRTDDRAPGSKHQDRSVRSEQTVMDRRRSGRTASGACSVPRVRTHPGSSALQPFPGGG